jgi:hypothetical protein
MTAFKNNSEMVLAVEGARGPPEGQKRILFPIISNAIIQTIKRGQKWVSQKQSEPDLKPHHWTHCLAEARR